MHRVVWQKGERISAILKRYTEYDVKNHYKRNAMVILDGYPENLADKSQKCACRMICSTTHTMFDKTMPANNKSNQVSFKQEKEEPAYYNAHH